MTWNPSTRRKVNRALDYYEHHLGHWKQLGLVSSGPDGWALTDRGRQDPKRQQIERLINSVQGLEELRRHPGRAR